MHVHFEEIGGSFEVVYVTEGNEELEISKIDDFDYLLYMFSFPKGDSFVPFQGSVHFYTDVDKDYCKKLLIPDWFKRQTFEARKQSFKNKRPCENENTFKGCFC